jgi:hypothetical protein
MPQLRGNEPILGLNSVGQLVVIDVNKQWLSLMSTYVMGVFGEVSKVVPLWCISKHGPHGKML